MDGETPTWNGAFNMCVAGAGVVGLRGRFGNTNGGGRRKRSYCYGRKKREAFDCNLAALAFADTDQNNDGLLEFSELKIKPDLDATIAKMFFDTKDLNNNNYLEPEEVHPCLTRAQLPIKSRRVKRCSYSTNYYQPYQQYGVYIS